MSQNTKTKEQESLVKPTGEDLQKEAKLALELHKLATEAVLQLERYKGYFRDYCLKFNDKKGLIISVPGVGAVKVNAPSAAKAESQAPTPEKIIFSVEKFNALPDKTKKIIINTGIVEITPAGMTTVAAKPEGTPAVSFDLNK